MNYVEQLKQKNVKFEIMSEEEATQIMTGKFSYYRLLSLSPCFEIYKRTRNKGKFVSLDFSTLYYLAEIDAMLSQIIMQMCMDIECSLKACLLYSVDCSNAYDTFLDMCYENGMVNQSSFVHSHDSYHRSVCNSQNENYMDVENAPVEFADFLEFVNFGTLVNLIRYFNDTFTTMEDALRIPGEELLISAKRIRNIVAHNNSILAKIDIPTSYHNLSIKTFLGKQGISNKTLKTNMSKAIVNDTVGLIFLYFRIVPQPEKIRKTFADFDRLYCLKYRNYFENNSLLCSLYSFLKSVINLSKFF